MAIEIQGMKFDSVEEMQDVMIFMHRIQGEVVPQDLLDEVAERRKLGRLEYSFHTVRAPKEELADGEVEKVEEESVSLNFKVGDKVVVVGNSTRHCFEIGEVREIERGMGSTGRFNLGDDANGWVNPEDIEHAEALGKDVNGEALYEGDYVTGIEGNKYVYTTEDEILEVIKKEDASMESYSAANIGVKFVNKPEHLRENSYTVSSTEFVKLASNLDDAKDEFYSMESVKEFESADKGFEVGDIVEVVSGYSLMYDKGDILELIRMDGDGVPLAKELGATGEQYISVESIIKYEPKPPKFEVGDKVKIVSNSTSGLEEGDVGEIKHVRNRDGEIEYSVKGDRFQASMLHPEQDLELYEEDKYRFKVGDTVVSNTQGGLHEVAIVDTDDDFLTYYISPGESWVPVWELVKADDEEVFESLTEAESDPQLGDIVTTTEELNSLTGEEIPPGTPIEVDYSTDTMIAGASGFRVIVIYHRDAEIDNRDKVKVAVRKADRLDI